MRGHVTKKGFPPDIFFFLKSSGFSSWNLYYFNIYLKAVSSRDGTIHLPPDSILSRYLGPDTICIAIFLRISILQVLRFDIAMCCDFSFFVFNSLDHGEKLNDTLNIQTVTIKKKNTS